MSNHERRTVEWMWRGGETVVVFLAMSCALSGRRRAGGDRSCRPGVCGVKRGSKTCLPSLRARVIGSIRMIPTGAPSPSEAAAGATSISKSRASLCLRAECPVLCRKSTERFGRKIGRSWLNGGCRSPNSIGAQRA